MKNIEDFQLPYETQRPRPSSLQAFFVGVFVGVFVVGIVGYVNPEYMVTLGRIILINRALKMGELPEPAVLDTEVKLVPVPGDAQIPDWIAPHVFTGAPDAFTRPHPTPPPPVVEPLPEQQPSAPQLPSILDPRTPEAITNGIGDTLGNTLLGASVRAGYMADTANEYEIVNPSGKALAESARGLSEALNFTPMEQQ